MKVALVGGDAYISAVLRPYVEFFSTKSPDWLTYIRFLVVPFGESVLLMDGSVRISVESAVGTKLNL